MSTAAAFALSGPVIIWMLVWALAGLGLGLLALRPRMSRATEVRRRDQAPDGACRPRGGAAIDGDQPRPLGW
jgi:hypothetical protein